MLSFASGSQLFQSLSQNSSASNGILYGQLANIEHRYLLQKYFANEGSYQMNTIGQTNLTLASAVAIGATSCTLDSAWGYQTVNAQLTFSDGEVVNGLFTNGSTTVTWTPALQGKPYGLTAVVAIGATTATLSTAWAYPSGSYVISFSDGSTKTATFTLNSTAISWSGGLAQDVGSTIYTSTIAAASDATIGGVQFYPMPPNYSKLKDLTITVGTLRWTMTEVRTREEWDNLNVFPYYASIPSKFFVYPGGDKGGQIGIWPIPSTTGNVITFNYKFRVPDLSLPDYGTATYTGLTGTLVVGDTITNAGVTGIILGFTNTNIAVGNLSGTLTAAAFTTALGAAGTISAVASVTATNGSTAVTGTGTAFIPTTNKQLESRWIMFPQPDGDGLWYQIANVSSTTALTLYQPYQGNTLTTKQGFIIGQMPLIAEDFQDMPVWKALQYYFSSIVDNEKKVTEYKDIYDRKLQLLADYSGSNTVNVNLSPKRAFRGNPNSYVQTVGQTP
jgi:hypothetical protein